MLSPAGCADFCGWSWIRTKRRPSPCSAALATVPLSSHLCSSLHTDVYFWNEMTTPSHYTALSLGIIHQPEFSRLYGPAVCALLNISVSSRGLNRSFDQISQAWKQTPAATNMLYSRLYNDHENCMRTSLHHHLHRSKQTVEHHTDSRMHTDTQSGCSWRGERPSLTWGEMKWRFSSSAEPACVWPGGWR